MKKFRGAFTALVTPMEANGNIDFDGLRSLVKMQLNSGIDGLVPLGTTAETPTLDESEEDKIIEVIFTEVRGFESVSGKKIPIILGAGSNNTRDTVRYTERAKKAGADAALVVTPYYNKPSNEGVFRHFEAVSKVGIPIIVYNIQGRTGKNIDIPTLMRIAELPNIAGVKEASGNISQMIDVIASVKSSHPDFAILSGDDGLTLALAACGGDGVVSVVSNIAPALIKEFTSAALSDDFAAARQIYHRFKAAFIDGNPSSIKYAMSFKKIIKGGIRLPLTEVTDSAKKIIEDALKECGL